MRTAKNPKKELRNGTVGPVGFNEGSCPMSFFLPVWFTWRPSLVGWRIGTTSGFGMIVPAPQSRPDHWLASKKDIGNDPDVRVLPYASRHIETLNLQPVAVV